MNIFAQKGSKIAAAKKVFLLIFPPVFTSFKRLFAPASQSLMSKLFLKFFKYLGKTNRKKCSQIRILFHIKGVKSPHKRSLPELCREGHSPVSLIMGFIMLPSFTTSFYVLWSARVRSSCRVMIVGKVIQ